MGAKLPAYKRLISEFLNESTIHGLKLLLLFVKCHHARKLWILFMSINIILTHYIVIKLSIEYINAPTEIRMSTNLVHVANSPFPAVAVCSANKISRRKLKIFAEEVFKHQESFKSRLLSRTPFEMEQELIMLTGFYVHPFKSYEFGDQRLAKLHQILSHMYNSSDYPSSDILLKLAPDCEDIVQRALIFGKMVNPRSLIIKNLTSLSVCCMFNYQRRRSNLIDDVNKEFNKITFQSNSILNSVQFVLQVDPNDTSYRDLPIDAFQIFLFPPEDYATLHSTTAGEILVDYNSIFEIQVQPEFSGASKRISQFSPFVRKCFFPAEGQQQIKQAYYSLDECLLVCRMQSMITYCGCVSPVLPAEILNATYCSLLDLPCLSQWRKIWYSWDYFDYVKSNNDAPENSLEKSVTTKSCRMCLPNCQGVEYNIYTNHLPLYKARKGNRYQHGLLKNMSDAKPLAIIKLYFKQRYALETQEDITGNWVELLSRYGGIMSLMYGFSIVSIIELFYYSTGKWFTHIYSTYQRYKNRKVHSNEVWKEGRVIDDSKEHKNITIYWHELAVKQNKLNYFEKAKLINYKKN